MNQIEIFIEVTNTLHSASLTGIQRTVKKLLYHLNNSSTYPYKYVPVYYCKRKKVWRRLTRLETIRLFSLRNRKSTIVSKVFTFLLSLYGCTFGKSVPHISNAKRVFFDLESSWHNPLKRSELLPCLIENNFLPIVLCYDVLPIVYPDLFRDDLPTKFRNYIDAHLQYARKIIAISETTKQAIIQYLERQSMDLPEIQTIQLGADISSEIDSNLKLNYGKYLLMVGTVEIRKNHLLLIDSYNSLSLSHPDLNLIFIGKKGWNAEEIIARIKGHSNFDKQVFLVGGG